MKKQYMLYVISLCLLILSFFDVREVRAAEKNEFPFISIETYSVTNEKIIPGSDFTLTLQLKNNSETTSAKNVVVGIQCPAGVSPKYGTPGQAFLKEIAKGDIVEISFEFSTIEEIYSYYLDFEVIVFCDDSNNTVVLRIPIGTDSPFNITNFTIEDVGVEGETISAAVAFKVIGIDFVKNIVIKTSFDGVETNAISVGALSPGTAKSLIVSVPLSSYGQHQIELSISYEDITGKFGTMEIGSQTVNVTRKMVEPTPTPSEKNMGVLDQLKSNTKMLAGIVGLILIVGFSVLVIILKSKGKR